MTQNLTVKFQIVLAVIVFTFIGCAGQDDAPIVEPPPHFI